MPRLLFVLLALAAAGCEDASILERGTSRAPVIEDARPASARPGQAVTLVGRNFGLPGERDLVVLGGQEVEVEQWADRALLVRVPPDATPGVFDFVVRTDARVSRPWPFEVLGGEVPARVE